VRLPVVIVILACLALATTAAYRFFRDDWVLYRSAERHFSRQSYAEAAHIYDSLVKRGFMKQNTLDHLEESYTRTGNVSAALGVLEVLSGRDPDNIWVPLKIAGIHDKLGDHEKAITIYRAILKKEPGNRSARIMFARSLVAANDFDGAIEQYKIILGELP